MPSRARILPRAAGSGFFATDRPQGFLAEGRALADFQLRRAAPDDDQQDRMCPGTSAGDDEDRPPRARSCGEAQFLPVGGHGE